MGWETAPEGGCSASASAAPATPSCSPNGKRSRDAAEDEVYLDNFHSHKRYLSELMACSLNGLSVGETLPENLMESPARSDHFREELAGQCSPMSEDSDDARCYDLSPAQADGFGSQGVPMSPHRCARFPAAGCPNSRRGSEAEARFPSSPNDVCHTGDLRRTALLRSVQMRAQPHGSPPACDLLFAGMASSEEGDRHCPCLKNANDDGEYRGSGNQFPGLLEENTEEDEPPSSC